MTVTSNITWIHIVKYVHFTHQHRRFGNSTWFETYILVYLFFSTLPVKSIYQRARKFRIAISERVSVVRKQKEWDFRFRCTCLTLFTSSRRRTL